MTLDEGLRCADYVSVHVRLTELTQGLINKDLLRKMKKTAILINVARGALVKEDDLIAAVREGMIGGAVLDVVTEEPIRPDSPLLQTENILVTYFLRIGGVPAGSAGACGEQRACHVPR